MSVRTSNNGGSLPPDEDEGPRPCSCIDDKLSRSTLEEVVRKVRPHLEKNPGVTSREIRTEIGEQQIPLWHIGTAMWHIQREHFFPEEKLPASRGTAPVPARRRQ